MNKMTMNTYILYIIGSKAYEKLSDVVLCRRLMKDVKKLSPHHQTSSLESYHSVLNHFAPKLLAFSYTGIYCRCVLCIANNKEIITFKY